MHRHFHSPLRFGLWAGAAIALLALPIFANLALYEKLGLYGVARWLAVIAWCFVVPIVVAVGLRIALLLPLPHTIKHQFMRYGVVGVLNTLLNLALFNTLLFMSGVVSGPLIPVFSAVTSAIVITVAFVINKFFVFDAHDTLRSRKEYILFFALTGAVALLNVLVITLLINVVGAPAGIDPKLWANIALLLTVPISVLGNFSSYKFIVFAKQL
jgi:putative flippase GtrA